MSVADTSNSAQRKYDIFLSRPVWPKAHTNRLRESYQGSSREDLAQEEQSRQHHVPLGASVSHTGRRAGTSGSSYGNARHPDDHPSRQHGLEAVIASKKKLTDEERETLRATARDAAQPEAIAADFKKLFDDPKIVISARDVKDLTPDFNTADGAEKEAQRKHGFARFTIPVTESQLKAQNWEGKQEQERKKKQEAEQKAKEQSKEADKSQNGSGQDDSDKNNSDKKGDASATDQKANREKDAGAEHGESTENMSSEQRAFLDNMIAEADTVSNFRNASGEPLEKELSVQAFDQVGFELQADDQFTPDVSFHQRSGAAEQLTDSTELDPSQ